MGATARLKRLAQRALATAAAAVPARVLARALPASQRFDPRADPTPLVTPSGERRLLIAPVNSAGQGWAWARSAERLPGVGAASMTIRPVADFGFPADQVVPLGEYRWSRRWQSAQRRTVMSGFTHVLLESGQPAFGDAFGARPLREVSQLREAGIHVALLFHGSDLRSPSRHREREADSPYAVGLWERTPGIELRTAESAELIRRADVPVFVSTPDLLDDARAAGAEPRWLPVVVDPERWSAVVPPLSRTGRPVVAHAPSRAIVKGSDLIDPVLQALHDEGLVEYRRISGVSSCDMPAAYGAADIVLDQFRIGSYGVAACEALAAGRIVVSHVADPVRATVLAETGLELPIVQSTARELSETIRRIIADPSHALTRAAAGPSFVRAVHDGRRSAAALAGFLGVDAPAERPAAE